MGDPVTLGFSMYLKVVGTKFVKCILFYLCGSVVHSSYLMPKDIGIMKH